MVTDQTLVEQAKTGDLTAFSELVVRHQKAMLRLAFRVVNDLELAQDITQESFLKAFQKIQAFEGRSQFKSWLFQITLNTAKNKLRSRRPDTVDIDVVQLAHGGTGAMQDLMTEDLRQVVQQEVAKLPPKQRTALTLRIFEDLSFQEIATIMQCPYDTAKANYRHALMKLRHSLGDSVEFKSWFPEESTLLVEVDA